MSWLQCMFRRRLYDDLPAESREHIEQRTEHLMRIEGMSRAEAHITVRIAGKRERPEAKLLPAPLEVIGIE
jgi:hypothetical protein